MSSMVLNLNLGVAGCSPDYLLSNGTINIKTPISYHFVAIDNNFKMIYEYAKKIKITKLNQHA